MIQNSLIQNTIHDLEAKIQTSENLSVAQRADLLILVKSLSSEVEQLAVTHQEDAGSIADFAQVTTKQVLRTQQNPALLKASVNALETSVEKFEASHPSLTQAVNTFCNYLSGMGI
ncbi:MAG: DUF4404 family protein [Spirochaetales bacterium]|nr:DUF4404 family protein [Spirochaetales bacterium]